MKSYIERISDALPLPKTRIDDAHKFVLELIERYPGSELQDFYLAKTEPFSKHPEAPKVDNVAQLAQIMAEIRFFSLLKSVDVDIEPIRATSVPTPDFRIVANGAEIFIEVKTPSYGWGPDGMIHEIGVNKPALAERDKILQSNATSGVSDVVVTELESLPRGLRKRTKHSLFDQYVVLADKCIKNVDCGQFKNPSTYLMVDNLIISDTFVVDDLLPAYEAKGRLLHSGALWNLAFARKGNIYFEPGEFVGTDNLGSHIDKPGVLIKKRCVQGLLVGNQCLCGRFELYGLFRGNVVEGGNSSDRAILECLKKTERFSYNDEMNTKGNYSD
jgi:hypothetical protein